MSALATLILPSLANFSLRSHWDNVYASPRTAQREWLTDADAALSAVCAHIDALEGRRVFVPGCGLSTLGESLAGRGWQVTNIDFSEACIRIGREQSRDERVRWEAMDVRELSFADASFDACTDKGTLDALMCGDAFDVDVARYAREVARVLRPGGRFVAVSLSQPSIALPLLRGVSGWTVETHAFGKYRLFVGSRTE
jgi:ubiquinone/menaquinone biosynthesis C-methylase UbiE